MAKTRVLTDTRQLTFEFVEPWKYEISLVGETPHGYGLFRRQEPHGGFSYFTDQYGVGYQCYDEGVSDMISTFSALEHLGEGERWWRQLGETFGYSERLLASNKKPRAKA
jgi:hypothetical protein